MGGALASNRCHKSIHNVQSGLKVARLLSVPPLSTYWCMHGTLNRLKLVAISTCLLFFHAIISEQKKIHRLKTEKSLRQLPMYLIFGVETMDVADRVVTDRQTHTHTDTHKTSTVTLLCMCVKD